MFFEFENYNTNDIDIIKKQLKSNEISICGISKKCKFGFPQIIFQNPVKEAEGKNILNYETISNLMWLTCPYLNFQIHELENLSFIEKIKKIIQNNVTFKNAMLNAHAHYNTVRNFIFTKYASSLFIEKVNVIENGIGGIRNPNGIKCLHLHFCHYNICRDNIVGLITYRLLDHKTNCDDRICGTL